MGSAEPRVATEGGRDSDIGSEAAPLSESRGRDSDMGPEWAERARPRHEPWWAQGEGGGECRVGSGAREHVVEGLRAGADYAFAVAAAAAFTPHPAPPADGEHVRRVVVRLPCCGGREMLSEPVRGRPVDGDGLPWGQLERVT